MSGINAIALFQHSEFLASDSNESDALPSFNPATATAEERLAMLKRIDAGEVLGVRFRALVFRDEPNLNRTRPAPGRLGDLAAAFPGKPLQSSHSTYDIDNLTGTVTTGEDSDGLVLGHELTEPETLKKFVRGELRTFSISYRAERFECSECQAGAAVGWFGPEFSCEHTFRDAELFAMGEISPIHNSFTGRPAYEGTELLSAYAHSNRTGESFFGLAPINSPEGDPMAENKTSPKKGDNDDQASQLAALQAQLDEANAARKSAEDAQFSAAFEAAVKARRVKPTQRAHFEAICEGMSLKFALDDLASREPLAEFAAEPQLDHSGEAPPVEDDWATARDAVRFSGVSQETFDRVKAGGGYCGYKGWQQVGIHSQN